MDDQHTEIDYFVDEETKEKLPSFARALFRSKKLIDDEKFKFKELILNPYLSSNDFRREHEGAKIIFGKGKLLGVQYGEGFPEFEDIPGTQILVFVISEKPPDYFMFAVYQNTINIGKTGQRPRTDLNFFYEDIQFTDKNRLIDTGASMTTIPFVDNWDYSKSEYKNVRNLRGRYSFDFTILNKNILSIQDVEMETADGICLFNILTWKKPVDVSLADLPPVKIKKMVIPLEHNKNLKLVGVDVLYEHTIIVSSNETGEVDLKIFPGINHQRVETNFSNPGIFKNIASGLGLSNLNIVEKYVIYNLKNANFRIQDDLSELKPNEKWMKLDGNSVYNSKVHILYAKQYNDEYYTFKIINPHKIDDEIDETLHYYIDKLDPLYKRIVFTSDDLYEMQNLFGIELDYIELTF